MEANDPLVAAARALDLLGAGWETLDDEAGLDALTRAEHARITVADRLRAGEGRGVQVLVRGAGWRVGRLLEAHDDHVVLGAADGARVLVPLAAAVVWRGVPRAARPVPELAEVPEPPGSSGARGGRPAPVPLRHNWSAALREVQESGESVTLLVDAGGVEPVQVRGPLTRTGRDHVDLGDEVVCTAAVVAVLRA